MNILQNKNDYDVIENITIINELPAANYELKYGAFGRVYLTKIDDIVLPDKIYSNDSEFINHVLSQWHSSDDQLGIGLVGGKGLGKSFTGNIISNELKIPVIRIKSNPKSHDIFTFLNSIKQEYCLYIDEFEKIFPYVPQTNNNGDVSLTTQDKFLNFLDNGGSISEFKKMFIITSNSITSINEFLKNRPSRLRYMRMYEKLDDKIIKEIVNDLLENKEFLNDLIAHLPYNSLNMDSLIEIIKEVNLHNKPYSTFKLFFNFTDVLKVKSYTVKLKETGEVITKSLKINNIYRDEKIGIFENKSCYFAETISYNIKEQESKAYFYKDENTEEYFDIIITENDEENKFKFLI